MNLKYLRPNGVAQWAGVVGIALFALYALYITALGFEAKAISSRMVANKRISNSDLERLQTIEAQIKFVPGLLNQFSK